MKLFCAFYNALDFSMETGYNMFRAAGVVAVP